MSYNIQEKMIGQHPKGDNIFSKWLDKEDKACTERKKHRALTEKEGTRDDAIDKIAEWLAIHHISEGKRHLVNRKKILDKYKYKKYAEELHVYPNNDTTRKGNLAEIVLSEYLQETSKNKNLVYKLRFNPNIDQSMKGDDVLLLNEEDLSKNIIVGESKFRTSPDKSVILEISKEFGNHLTLPLSLTFVADRLFEEGKIELSERIYDLHENLYKGQIDIINVGFLFSNLKSASIVEKHMDSDNNNFIMISLGVDKPQDIIEKSYRKAIENIKGE